MFDKIKFTVLRKIKTHGICGDGLLDTILSTGMLFVSGWSVDWRVEGGSMWFGVGLAAFTDMELLNDGTVDWSKKFCIKMRIIWKKIDGSSSNLQISIF